MRSCAANSLKNLRSPAITRNRAERWARYGSASESDRYLKALDKEVAAEVLLRVGVLTSCIGSAKQISEAQEIAKNLISESLAIFEKLRDESKIAEAQIDLALCYWRQGAHDEARVMLRDVLSRLGDAERELKATALIRWAFIEWALNRYSDALRILTEAEPLVKLSKNDSLKGKFHNQLALIFRSLSTSEQREDHLDRALIEYAAASYHFEQAGHERYLARVENNLGFLFSTVGKFTEAYEHLGRARKIFARLKDSSSTAQVDDTYARVLLAEGRTAEAEQVASSAVRILNDGGESMLLTDALITYGTTLARLGHHVRARQSLQRASELAQEANDHQRMGTVALTVIEELDDRYQLKELSNLYEQAADILAKSQNADLTKRLLKCSRKLVRKFRLQSLPPSERMDEQGFSFRSETLRLERQLIERALKESGGSVSRAAKMLGFRHHGSLITIINHRHQELLSERAPVQKRKRSIIKKT